ncbi:hypothetical protein TTRE_0000921501 [Trichuris trichiura]|uniref:Uncharacterized protein n=1 Tax=Trichuris trichiura TaxID=36087 RepID=A0A077ZKE3_TRITR|nr:hypothetical protein TTRE_0000921501 [Trichuris trichiura]
MEKTNDEQLKPTEVLRNMRRAGETLLHPNGTLMERLFLERLPRNIFLLLKACVHESLDALAAHAEELVEIDVSTAKHSLSEAQCRTT